MSKSPNFLLIITDRKRADHVGCYGNAMVRTPYIDSLAARGFRAEQRHVQHLRICVTFHPMGRRVHLLVSRLGKPPEANSRGPT